MNKIWHCASCLQNCVAYGDVPPEDRACPIGNVNTDWYHDEPERDDRDSYEHPYSHPVLEDFGMA